MNITQIKTETDYRITLNRLEESFAAPVGSLERDVADILGLMVDEFENKHYSIEAPEPI